MNLRVFFNRISNIYMSTFLFLSLTLLKTKTLLDFFCSNIHWKATSCFKQKTFWLLVPYKTLVGKSSVSPGTNKKTKQSWRRKKSQEISNWSKSEVSKGRHADHKSFCTMYVGIGLDFRIYIYLLLKKYHVWK